MLAQQLAMQRDWQGRDTVCMGSGDRRGRSVVSAVGWRIVYSTLTD
jgi:hypothetical protein